MWYRVELLVRGTSMTTPFREVQLLANTYVIVDHERGSPSA
jgi:hypothetical protein